MDARVMLRCLVLMSAMCSLVVDRECDAGSPPLAGAPAVPRDNAHRVPGDNAGSGQPSQKQALTAEIEAWFDRTARTGEGAGDRDDVFSDRIYTYRVIFGDPRDVDRIAALRAEVTGKPDHPKRAELVRLEAQAGNGRRVTVKSFAVAARHTGLASGDQGVVVGVWRLSTDQVDEKTMRHVRGGSGVSGGIGLDAVHGDAATSYFDVGSSENGKVWGLATQQLGITSASAPPQPGYDYADLAVGAQRELAEMMSQGLSVTRQEGMTLGPVVLESPDGSAWSRRAWRTDDDNANSTRHTEEWLFRGTWTVAGQQMGAQQKSGDGPGEGQVTERVLVRFDAAPEFAGQRSRILHAPMARAGASVEGGAEVHDCSVVWRPAKSIEFFAPPLAVGTPARLERTVEWLSCSHASHDEIARLANVPELGQSDPVRGIIQPRRLVDFEHNSELERPDDPSNVDVHAHGSVGTEYVENRPAPNARSGFFAVPLRAIGWGVLGVLVVVFVVVRLRRS